MNKGLSELIKNSPDIVNTFEGSEFPLSINLALYGQIPDVLVLKNKAKKFVQIDLADESNPPRENDVETLDQLKQFLIAEMLEWRSNYLHSR